MALTWGTLAAGLLLLLALPAAIYWLNRWRRPAGWVLLGAAGVLFIAGHILEEFTLGTSPLFP